MLDYLNSPLSSPPATSFYKEPIYKRHFTTSPTMRVQRIDHNPDMSVTTKSLIKPFVHCQEPYIYETHKGFELRKTIGRVPIKKHKKFIKTKSKTKINRQSAGQDFKLRSNSFESTNLNKVEKKIQSSFTNKSKLHKVKKLENPNAKKVEKRKVLNTKLKTKKSQNSTHLDKNRPILNLNALQFDLSPTPKMELSNPAVSRQITRQNKKFKKELIKKVQMAKSKLSFNNQRIEPKVEQKSSSPLEQDISLPLKALIMNSRRSHKCSMDNLLQRKLDEQNATLKAASTTLMNFIRKSTDKELQSTAVQTKITRPSKFRSYKDITQIPPKTTILRMKNSKELINKYLSSNTPKICQPKYIKDYLNQNAVNAEDTLYLGKEKRAKEAMNLAAAPPVTHKLNKILKRKKTLKGGSKKQRSNNGSTIKNGANKTKKKKKPQIVPRNSIQKLKRVKLVKKKVTFQNTKPLKSATTVDTDYNLGL